MRTDGQEPSQRSVSGLRSLADEPPQADPGPRRGDRHGHPRRHRRAARPRRVREASTNRIAKCAGVSIGSLYHYFDDKDAIVKALVERVVQRQLTTLGESLQASFEMDPEEGVRALVHGALESQKVEAELAHVLLPQCPREGREDLDREWKRRSRAGSSRLLDFTVTAACSPCLSMTNFSVA
ncbi:MAG: TetR/AcrR family transcriptional regulator [Proteobacteria bacterium]|nr:TetR/AcrR family transcriptional regulator [Pseudomonadota bacterium]MCP4918204.1 TetR/AcrR family transcriptional regulator [Pseudomonadota bacterium]